MDEQVFVHGQGVPAELELEYEDECVHFLAFNSEQQPVGTGRLREVDDLYIKFERVRAPYPLASVTVEIVLFYH